MTTRWPGALVAALVSFCSSSAFAGGWTQAEGTHYAKVWGNGLFGSSAFGLDGETVATGSFSLLSLRAYGEYGLRPNLTLVAFASPFGLARMGDDAIAHSGTFLAGFRQRFIDRTLQVAVEARFGGAPGWGDENLAPVKAEYVFVPTFRTWQTEWELQFGYPLPFGWVALSVGPKAYTNPALSHALGGSLQVGAQFGQFVVDLHSTLNWTFRPLEFLNVTGAGNTRYIGIGLGLSWWPSKRVGIHAGADGALYAASNAEALSTELGVETR